MTRTLVYLSIALMLFCMSRYALSDVKNHNMQMKERNFICPMHPQIIKDNPGDCPVCGMDLVLQKQSSPMEHMHHDHSHNDHLHSNKTYICPMHPNIVSDHEADCPICGMDLALQEQSNPMEQTQHDQEVVKRFSVSGEMQQAMALITEPVTQGEIKTRVITYGTVQFDESGLSHIHPRAEGWIERLTVNTVGQRITKGELLYEMYSPALLVAQEDFLSLLSTTRNTPALIERGRRRLELLGFSTSLIKELEEKREVFYRVPYYALQNGIVSVLNVREGMYSAPANRIMTVADLSSVWVIADVYEDKIDSIRLGQTTRLDIPALDLYRLEGKVEFVYPTLDPVTKTLRIRLTLDNPDEKLKPDMLGQITIETDTIVALNINQKALIQTERQNRVIIQNQNGQFELRPVQVGITSDGRAEITNGLSLGEKVVTSGQFLLDAEASLQNMLSHAGHHQP